MSLSHQDFRRRQTAITLNGISHKPLTVAFTEMGRGPPIILLHGIPTWSYLYNDVIPLLAPHMRVIAPDFLGHGYSDRRELLRPIIASTN